MNSTVHDPDDVRELPAASDMALVSAISRAELDQLITTARAYPRSLNRFVKECRDMACLNEKVASECYYVLPRGGKNIEGPSVRLAEIVQSSWGNSQAGARVVDEGPEFVTAQGVFHDLERNVKVTMEVRRRITDKHGKRFNADMIGVTGNAACSVALRNAIFRGIPKAFWTDIYEEARKVAAGNIKSLVTNRTQALTWLARRGVHEGMVLGALGVQGIEDIGLDELATLRGMVTAIKDGEATVETIFAPKEGDAPKGKPKTDTPKSKKDKAAAKDAAKGDGTEKDKPPAEEPTITNDQFTALTDRLQAEGIDVSLLCAQFEIGILAELPKSKLDAAIAWLDKETAPATHEAK